MAKAANRPATYEDLLKVPEHLVAEIVEGELFTSPRPRGPHERTESRLTWIVGTRFDDGEGGPGGWWIPFEPELHLGSDVLVPDIGGWRRERVPVYEGTPWKTVPDWICEIVSSSSNRLDRIRKLPRYALHGVAYAWLVDPVERTLEVYRLVNGNWSLIATHEGDEVIRAEPFDAIEIPLATLWLPSAPA